MTCPRCPSRPWLVVLFLAAFSGLPAAGTSQAIPSPEEFFGFQMGADRQLARWDQLVTYYDSLGVLSDRLEVVHMGLSTLGNPFLVIFASSPENIANLDEIRRLNAILQDPRGHSQAEVEAAIDVGKVVFVQSYGLHSNEVAASQTAAEVMYDLATRNDEEMADILDNIVSIMIPSFNPDGEIMVTDWYNTWVGTEYEGSGVPSLYHHYIGHDNNRDAFMQNTVESQYGAQILFRQWVPQAYIDHHQMGAYTARIYLPPYAEPIRPEADPLVWREMTWYGAHIAYKMDEAELTGAIGSAIYSGWGHFGFHWITPFHNIAGMLTESASARLASPLFVHPDQLEGSRQFPEYAAQTTFPSPWPGGWWRVRDIVERQKVATFSPLQIAAQNRRTVLRNAHNKASRQIRRGAEGDVAAYIIPAEQHDPLTMQKLVNRLLGQGITVDRAVRAFTHEGRTYQQGTYVVSMAQPKRGVIRWLLGRTFYPDNSFTRDRDGDPIRPYDMSTDNLAEFMGVRVDPVGSPIEASSIRVSDAVAPGGTITSGPYGYVLDTRLNDSFEAVNRLLAGGALVRRASRDGERFRQGDFLVSVDADPVLIREVVDETGVPFRALTTDAAPASYPLTPLRIGLFQRYYGGNIDEGWTRWLLEDFAFDYATVMDAQILQDQLRQSYDVIILPSDSKELMVEGRDDEEIPPEYRSGFGDEGVRILEEFVRQGGTLVSFAEAGDLPIDEFDLPVRNAVSGLSGDDFWSPGSTLRVRVDARDRFALGMPEAAVATFLAGGQVYETERGSRSADVRRLVTYVDRDVLQSGWLLGEEAIAGRAAVVSVEHGEGTVLLIGFRAQHRAQTHGTFKLLFNALMSAP